MEKNKCGNRYSPEVRERAVRMVFEHHDATKGERGSERWTSLAIALVREISPQGRGLVANSPCSHLLISSERS